MAEEVQMGMQLHFTVWSSGLRGLRIIGMYLKRMKKRKGSGIRGMDLLVNAQES